MNKNVEIEIVFSRGVFPYREEGIRDTVSLPGDNINVFKFESEKNLCCSHEHLKFRL